MQGETGEAGIVERLKELFGSMKEWERRPVLKSGEIIVELVKLPGKQLKSGNIKPEKLVLHIRLEGSFKGIFVEKHSQLEDLREALSSKRIEEIARALDEVNRRGPIEFEL